MMQRQIPSRHCGVKISASIIYYNSGDTILSCIKSLSEQTLEPIELIIVENRLVEEDVLNTIEQSLHDTKLVRLGNGNNVGFARAVNLAMENANGDYLFLLSCDVILESQDYLEKLLEIFNKYKNCFSASGLLLFRKTEKVWSSGCFFDPVTGFNWHLGWKMPIEEIPRKIIHVDYLPFAAALVRQDLLKDLNGLDEHFFVYGEDMDISLRARYKGYVSIVDTSIYAYHDVEEERRGNYLFRYYHQIIANVHIFIKHLPFPNILTAFTTLILGLTFAEIFLLRVDSRYQLAKIMALRWQLKKIRETISERRKIFQTSSSTSEPQPKIRASINAMLRHVRLRGHSW